MIKFPSIDQFRNAIRRVKDITQYAGKDEDGNPIFNRDATLPVLPFRGLVKIHGTNAGVVRDLVTGETTFQSRERVITPTDDNAGFAAHMINMDEVVDDIVRQVFEIVPESVMGTRPSKVAIFGEWCGKGIMKGVAVNELPKMYVIFAVKVVWDEKVSFQCGKYHSVEDEDHLWMDVRLFDIHYPQDDIRIFNVATFGNYFIDIDFARPELAQNQMVEMTEWVENKCPVGAFFGIDDVGEGIVWHCTDYRFGSDVWFKVKGEAHSASKVKTLAAVDVEEIARLSDLMDSVVSEARLEQGVWVLTQELKLPLEMSSMGEFIRWVYNDVLKEEMDTITENGFDPKKLGSHVANRARPWFVKRLNSDS